MKRLSPLKLPANHVALFSVSRRTSLRRGGCTSHLSVERRRMIEKKKVETLVSICPSVHEIPSCFPFFSLETKGIRTDGQRCDCLIWFFWGIGLSRLSAWLNLPERFSVAVDMTRITLWLHLAAPFKRQRFESRFALLAKSGQKELTSWNQWRLIDRMGG